MITVTLLRTEFGRLAMEAGNVEFYAVPVQEQDDFQCRPPYVISLEEAKTISAEVARQRIQGRIGWYEWRKND
jgi:hypothetical protein